jgi:hypothetical protein
MSDRVILALKFTPAGAPGQVRRAVGGFLRYVQHRDLHPTEPGGRPKPQVAGLLKYVAYRDRASARAELFGPSGTLDSSDRKAFAAFAAGALEGSCPQLYRARNGEMQDRRRAVYRMVISPEHASGLDLRQLTATAVSALERDCSGDLRWIAAIHRNTAHHHVHLVLAGMRADGHGGFVRVDITKARLAAMKTALGAEILRQRAEREPARELRQVTPRRAKSEVDGLSFDAGAVPRWARTHTSRPVSPWLRRNRSTPRPTSLVGSVISLRAVARRYQRQMERELEQSQGQVQLEHAA